MIFIPLLIAVVVVFAMILAFLIIRKLIKQQERIAKERINKEFSSDKAGKAEQTAASQSAADQPVSKKEQPEIHYHVNTENFYAGDVGVVASDDAVVNRANINQKDSGRCPKCGAEISSGDVFCKQCGAKLK